MLKVSKERLNTAEKQAKKLLETLSLTEKIGQLTQFGTSLYNDEVRYFLDHYEEGKIGSYLTVRSAAVTNKLQKECKEKFPTHIPLLFADDTIHGYKTIMPDPLAQSCTWEPEKAEQCARVAAKEAYIGGLRWTFSPMVDIARDPRWGRIVEGYGEDPYLCSKFSAATVEGYQGNELGEKYHIMACMKHFVGYGACLGGRDYAEVDMSLQTLHDVYLPSFKAGIEAGAATVMSAFNSLNGVPCTANKYLLQDVLRKEYGFDGFVVSDAGSVHELAVHGYAEDTPDAALKAMKAGVNMLMTGDLFNDNLPKFIEEGKLSEEDIDKAVLPILTMKYLMGLFENPFVDESEEEIFYCDEHRAVGREVARECVVLLENNGILPLTAEKSVALIGPKADNGYDVLGCWTSFLEEDKTVTLRKALENRGIKVNYAKGSDFLENTQQEIEEAVEAAKKSDVAVLVLGEHRQMNGEGRSRSSLEIPEAQQEVLDAIIKTGKPVVLLISAGRPIIVEKYIDKVAAIAYVWQLGTEFGNAVADVIYGDCDTSGRLTVSVPRSEGQLPVYYNHLNGGRPYIGVNWYESQYIDLTPLPRYPFGYGKSYTEYEYSNLKLSSDKMEKDGKITATFTVKNIGKRKGKTTAQLYVRDLVGSVVRPVKELKGFEKIELNPNEEATISITLNASDLAFHNDKMEYVVESGKFNLWIGQNSSDETLCAEFAVV